MPIVSISRSAFATTPLLLIVACTSPGSREITAPASDIAREPAATAIYGAIEKVTPEILEPLPVLGGARVIKFALFKDRKGQFTRMVLIDPKKFEFHYQFLQTIPDFKNLTQKQIEAITYKASPDRKAILGMVALKGFLGDSDFEDMMYQSSLFIMSDDVPSAEIISGAIKQFAAKSKEVDGDYATRRLYFSPLAHQAVPVTKIADSLKKLGVRIRSSEMQGISVYNDGWGIGKVVIAPTQADVDAGIANGSIGSNTILITNEALRELPPVAGVVSGAQLTAGSHLVLLAQMYGLPLFAAKDAVKEYASTQGHWAVLATSTSREGSVTFTDRLTEDERKTLVDAHKRPLLSLSYDSSTTAIAEVASLSNDAVGAYGGKATKFGLLRRTIPAETRDLAVGVPIAYFKRFMTESKAQDGRTLAVFVTETLRALPADANYTQVEAAGKLIRETLKAAATPPKLAEEIRTGLIAQLKPGAAKNYRVKIRSSSNVEDGAEFNGAGLYDSDGACLTNCDKDDFAKSLNKVWRSLYTTRGLWARRQFNVDESKVGMGLVVHQPFKNELFNGVVKLEQFPTTKTVFIEDPATGLSPGVDQKVTGYRTTIISQKGEEESVTNASGTASAEVATLDDENLNVQQALRGLPKERPALAQAHYLKLQALMQKIIAAWPKQEERMEIEAEWKLMPDPAAPGGEKLFIKQVRQVPHPRTLFLPDNSGRLNVTGGTLRLEGSPELYDVVASLFRIRSGEIKLHSFTSEDLKAERIQFGEGSVDIAGRKYAVRPKGKPSVTVSDYSWATIKQEFEIDQFSSLAIELSANANEGSSELAIGTPESLRYTLTSAKLKGALSDGWSGTMNVIGITPDTSFAVEPTPKTKITYITKGACPIKIESVRRGRTAESDGMFYFYDSISISGLLPRPIKLQNELSYSHGLRVHEGIDEMALDLFGDETLTAADKQKLESKFGRYLAASLGTVDEPKEGQSTHLPTKYSVSFDLLKSNLEKAKPIKGCEGRSNTGGFAEEE